MSFSDSDWTSDAAAAAATRRDGALAWALALGIVIGAAGATVVLYAVDRLPGRASQSPPSPNAPAVTAALPTPPPVLIDRQPPAAGHREPAPASAGIDDSVVASGPSPTPSPRPSEDELRRKERAWARFYQRPASCEGNPSTDQLIECANHFIRSKREFDARWKAGTL